MNTSERYSRQTMLPQFGEEGQRRLAVSSVLVAGLGGLGSAAATYLAAAGVGRLVLCDPDTVSLSNLQRQVLYSEEEIGLSKAAAAEKRLRRLNSGVRYEVMPDGIRPENAGFVAGVDLVVDCTDNYPARFLIDDACAAAGKPWVHGALGEFSGCVAVFGGESGARYSDLYPDREELCALPRPTLGVLGAVPGVIGAIQASEALKVLAGCGEPLWERLFTIDLLTMETNIIKI